MCRSFNGNGGECDDISFERREVNEVYTVMREAMNSSKTCSTPQADALGVQCGEDGA